MPVMVQYCWFHSFTASGTVPAPAKEGLLPDP